MESPDGKYFYYARGRIHAGGLWRRRLGGTPGEAEELVLGSLQSWGWWTVSSNGILFLESENATAFKVHLKLLHLRSKRITDLRTLEYPVNSAEASLGGSIDGLHVAFEQGEGFGGRIMMIENFRKGEGNCRFDFMPNRLSADRFMYCTISPAIPTASPFPTIGSLRLPMERSPSVGRIMRMAANKR